MGSWRKRAAAAAVTAWLAIMGGGMVETVAGHGPVQTIAENVVGGDIVAGAGAAGAWGARNLKTPAPQLPQGPPPAAQLPADSADKLDEQTDDQ